MGRSRMSPLDLDLDLLHFVSFSLASYVSKLIPYESRLNSSPREKRDTVSRIPATKSHFYTSGADTELEGLAGLESGSLVVKSS